MKPKIKSTSRASKPRKSATKSSPARKAIPKAKPGIQSHFDWRVETLSKLRQLIHAADPEIIEERKWRKPSNPEGVPVWSHGGIVCTGETYKAVVKLTFMRGAALKDPGKLFNSSLEGNARRAIDIHEGETLDAKAFKALIQEAVAANLGTSGAKAKAPAKGKAGAKIKPGASDAKPVKLLSGGNPQIAKAEGDAPVQAYIAAIPVGWKRDIAKRLDALIVRNAPKVQKAVKWNSPFYGIAGQGWFVSFHVFTNYVKVSFFKGTSLKPAPQGGTGKDARWIDIHEDDLDEKQMSAWVKQAAAIPGWAP